MYTSVITAVAVIGIRTQAVQIIVLSHGCRFQSRMRKKSMRLIDGDELIEHVWRDRVDSRERIANLVESMPTIKAIPVTGVIPYSIKSDGTLTITVPKGTKRIGRILIEEDDTQYGGLFYPDTGGCFLSSMERSEQD